MGLPECAKMLRGIVIRTQLDVFRGAFLGDPSTRAYDGVVSAGFKGGTGKAPTRTRSPSVKCAAESCRDCRSVVTTIGVEVAWEELEEAAST